MWTCPNCSEQLEDQFDACWKCGTKPDGGRIADFEPDPEGDVPDVGPDEKREPVRLPTVTYFSIPVVLITAVAYNCYIEWNNWGETPRQRFEQITAVDWVIGVGVWIFGVLFVCIPALAALIRTARQKPRKELIVARRFRFFIPIDFPDFRFFLLPAEFRERYPWFTPVYYGSIVACFVAPVVFGVALLWWGPFGAG